MDKKEFSIRVTYFKPSGKYYTDEVVTRKFRSTEGGICYMPDVCAWIRGLNQDADETNPLPGLSSGWGGPILVDCDEGFPHLILPRS